MIEKEENKVCTKLDKKTLDKVHEPNILIYYLTGPRNNLFLAPKHRLVSTKVDLVTH